MSSSRSQLFSSGSSSHEPVSLYPPLQTPSSDAAPPIPLRPLEKLSIPVDEYPRLDNPPRTDFTLPGYALSAHVFPAAWPRCPSSPFNPPPAHEAVAKPIGKEAVTALVDHLVQAKESQESGRDQRPPNTSILWTVANRIYSTSPTHGSKGLTLVFLHGIGGHKESWEPTIKRVLSSLHNSSTSLPIEEIWILDAVQHGDSATLNETSLGDTFDFGDNSRDILNFLTFYLPSRAQRRLPTALPRVADLETAERHKNGLASRTLVGIGHSMGGCSLIRPAILYPKVFSSLVLIEAFILPSRLKYMDAHRKNEASCLRRKWAWKSLVDAIVDLSTSPYYKSWNAETLKQLMLHGITKTPDDKYFTLKTHPYFEAMLLVDRFRVYEAWDLLPQLDPSLPIHWIWGGKSKRLGGPEVQAETVYRPPGRNTNVWYPSIGHLFPQEAPDVLAVEILSFLRAQYPNTVQATSRL